MNLRALLFLLCAAGCGGGPNTLSGSVSEVYSDLSFDQVAINLIDSYLVIEYQKGKDGTQGKTLKLSIYVKDLTIAAGNSVDLAGTVGNLPRASAQRIIEGTIDLGVERGQITFDQAPEAGATVSGKFNTLTQMPSGRTLNGTFQAKVTQL